VENYPGRGLGDHNNCRDPDGEEQLWCYTTNPNVRWDYCTCADEVPPPTPAPTPVGAECTMRWTIELTAVANEPVDGVVSIIEFERGRVTGSIGGVYAVSLRSVGPGEGNLYAADRFTVPVHYM
jgi:hypothetical protein